MLRGVRCSGGIRPGRAPETGPQGRPEGVERSESEAARALARPGRLFGCLEFSQR